MTTADPLYSAAVAVVRTHQKASISLVQRTLQIGYCQAALLLEQMEREGLVGPLDLRGHRPLLTIKARP